MTQLLWKEPNVNDADFIHQLANHEKCLASDCSYTNLFLLRNKYRIEIAYYKDYLLRRYNGTGSRSGYCFPIGSGDILEVLTLLQKDAKEHNRKLDFCLLSEEQKNQLERSMPDIYEFVENRDDSDYIYLQSALALLKGKKYHKKKNHVSQFSRKYPTHFFKEITPETKEDALKVARQWLNERMPKADPLMNAELQAIEESLLYFEDLHLMGCILYIDTDPIAMTIASPISENACDVHYEKALDNYAMNGAYAAINQHFASMVPQYTYLNREEDIGIPGLRTAKLSYHPDILLSKYYAIVK